MGSKFRGKVGGRAFQAQAMYTYKVLMDSGAPPSRLCTWVWTWWKGERVSVGRFLSDEGLTLILRSMEIHWGGWAHGVAFTLPTRQEWSDLKNFKMKKIWFLGVSSWEGGEESDVSERQVGSEVNRARQWSRLDRQGDSGLFVCL